MDGCNDVKLVIVLKALIVIGIFAEYYLGKKGTSGLEMVLTTVMTMVTLIVFGIVIVTIRIIERVKR